MWRVIVRFKDLQDHNHLYNVGDMFPRIGLEVPEKRIKSLASANNKRGIPLIESVRRTRRKEKEDVNGTMPRVEELV